MEYLPKNRAYNITNARAVYSQSLESFENFHISIEG